VRLVALMFFLEDGGRESLGPSGRAKHVNTRGQVDKRPIRISERIGPTRYRIGLQRRVCLTSSVAFAEPGPSSGQLDSGRLGLDLGIILATSKTLHQQDGLR
jgi:hypothetical protein